MGEDAARRDDAGRGIAMASSHLLPHHGSIDLSARSSLALWAPGIALAICYWDVVYMLANQWWSNSMYTHGFLIPIIAAYVCWATRNQLPAVCEPSFAWGVPALLGGQMDAYGRLAVRIGRLSNGTPPFETVTLKLMRGAEEVCTLRGDVSEWKAQAQKGALEPRLKSWMESNQLDRTVFVGEAPVRIDQCPREKMRGGGLVLELLGANPLVARAAVH